MQQTIGDNCEDKKFQGPCLNQTLAVQSVTLYWHAVPFFHSKRGRYNCRKRKRGWIVRQKMTKKLKHNTSSWTYFRLLTFVVEKPLLNNLFQVTNFHKLALLLSKKKTLPRAYLPNEMIKWDHTSRVSYEALVPVHDSWKLWLQSASESLMSTQRFQKSQEGIDTNKRYTSFKYSFNALFNHAYGAGASYVRVLLANYIYRLTSER